MSKKAFTTLLVESDASDASRILQAFQGLGLGQGLHWVSGLEAAMRYLSGQGEFSDRARFPLPSLILVSLALSRRADFRLLRWMREQSPEVRRVPVVELAASRQPPGFDQACNLGAVSYLVEPLDPEALGSLVKAVAEFWKLDGKGDELMGVPPAAQGR